MNTGAFGENFPYTNFHNLNMDWIVKIAKDFLDQYTNIQNTIDTGLENLNSTSAELLQGLNARYEEIDGLLNQWYNTHSEDIATQLATALSTLSTQVQTAITTINSETNTQLQRLLDTIPADVSEIIADLNSLKSTVENLGNDATLTVINNNYIANGGGFTTMNGYRVSIARCKPNDVFIIKVCYQYVSTYRAYMFLNSSFEIIERSDVENGSHTDLVAVAPNNASYIVVNNSEPDSTYNGRTIYKVEGINFNQLTGIFYNTGLVSNNSYFSLQDNHFTNANGYHAITVNCKAGDTFRICGQGYGSLAPANPTYTPWVIRNASHEILDYCRVFRASYQETVTDVITIPENGTELIITYENVQGYAQKFGNPFDEKKLAGKKMVWFGTSIPANKVNGLSYPEVVASELGATIYNESYGSSAMSDIVPINECRSRNLAMTYAEKQVQSWWSGLTDAEKTIARDTSFDYKVAKYLSGGSVGQVDVYVFDHGYNDYYYINPEGYYTEPENPYDKHYPLGASHFLIQSILNDNPRATIIWIGHYEGDLLDPTDHQSWGRAVIPLQKLIAEKHQIPLCNLWEKTGWGNTTKVTTTGYWDNGYWVGSGGDTRQDYVKNCQFADGIHPTSDKSGEAMMKIAKIITGWMNTIF